METFSQSSSMLSADAGRALPAPGTESLLELGLWLEMAQCTVGNVPYAMSREHGKSSVLELGSRQKEHVLEAAA